MKVLYVCNEDRATTKQRIRSIKDLEIDVDIVFTNLMNKKVKALKKIIRALSRRLGFFPERNNENKNLLFQINSKSYDILFVEKGLSIKLSTLNKVKKIQPNIKIISYTLDDMMNKKNSSVYYRRCIPIYDFHFTNKKFNVKELENLGARNVNYFKNGYSEHVHRPLIVSEEEKDFFGSEVSFIGTYEEERAMYLRYIASKGIKVKIWGWGKSALQTNMSISNIILTNKYVYDDEFAKVISCSKINLCFLRKENRDTETTRSIEIPACGGFMLAERTNEHLELFKENIEAAYFDSMDELLNKVLYFLKENECRELIAKNGYTKCIQGGYTYQNQLKSIFSKVLG